MVKLWSEVPAARMREIAADVATLAWVGFWGSTAWTLFSFCAQFAEAGRLVRGGGESLQAAGDRVGTELGRLPLVGDAVSQVVRRGFDGAGVPIADAGRELETFILLVAATLALLVVVVPVLPWLARYLPWRVARIRHLRSAHQAVRRPGSTPLGAADVERVLAGRALHRLDWDTLLEYTPDPIGDWHAGRLERLARAELATVGLRR